MKYQIKLQKEENKQIEEVSFLETKKVVMPEKKVLEKKNLYKMMMNGNLFKIEEYSSI